MQKTDILALFFIYLFILFVYFAGDNLYLNVDAQAVCRFDPCKYTTCLQGAAAKCVVNTRCHPVFLDAFGKRIKCKGTYDEIFIKK